MRTQRMREDLIMAVDTQVGESLLAQAIEIAESAAQLTLEWFQGPGLGVKRKQDGTVVTEADIAAEDLIRSTISDRFPNDEVFGEERGTAAGTSGRKWIIDPIDGTISFVRGVPLYSTLLALVDAAGPAVGVICLPALGETVAAGRGLGAFLKAVDHHAQAAGRADDQAHRFLLKAALVGFGDRIGNLDPDKIVRSFNGIGL